MTRPGDYTLRCRACEAQLGMPMGVDPAKYGLVENKHGAVVRECLGCRQKWLGFAMQLPNQSIKILTKKIDKLL